MLAMVLVLYLLPVHQGAVRHYSTVQLLQGGGGRCTSYARAVGREAGIGGWGGEVLPLGRMGLNDDGGLLCAVSAIPGAVQAVAMQMQLLHATATNM